MQLLFSLLLCLLPGLAQTNFDRAAYYSVITGSDLKAVDRELSYLENIQGKEALKGALLMKKAGMVGKPGEKLNLFSIGHKALEQAIGKDSTNAEYRFLRLIIQENAPKIVNYSSALKKDASYLRSHYKTLPAVVQQAVINYSQRSKQLAPGDFKLAAHE